MAEYIIMPKQGLQMTKGTIIEWLVQEGDKIVEDMPLFDMETDKLTITIESSTSGTLLKILHGAGDEVPITEPIAIVGEKGEDITSLLENSLTPQEKIKEKGKEVKSTLASDEEDSSMTRQTKGKTFISPRAKMMVEESGLDYLEVNGTGPEGLIIEKDIMDILDNTTLESKSSPLARKIASLHDVNLEEIKGTGVRDKIMVKDVREALAEKSIPYYIDKHMDEERIPVRGMRKIVAQRMKESLTEMAQANHRMSVDMTKAVELRNHFKEAGRKISYNDIILRCTAKALTEYPIMNSSWTDEDIIIKKYVNIGMAVALDQGLIVPVIKNIDLKSLEDISKEASELAVKAKENKLQIDDYSGGTFTVSNLGMYDIDGFTAVINSPEAGILAVGKIEKQTVVIDDEIVIRTMMQLSLTYDHRIVDGAPAAQFLRRIKELLENPMLLI